MTEERLNQILREERRKERSLARIQMAEEFKQFIQTRCGPTDFDILDELDRMLEEDE